ncbi:MAG: aldehyde dehydrogenase family protein, partial [Chloroflexota bacterium]|nr:aldehyde dehydrogenase family protein [Chloroflexota bacterium]
MATTHLKNYIDGRWVDSVSGDAFEDTDPANGDVIATATKSSTADVDKAVEAAKRAADGWRLYPA